jgi:hypothetical protein
MQEGTQGSRAARKRRRMMQERIWKNIWLVIPVGIIGVVITLVVLNGRKTADSPLAETFEVTSPGTELPPRPAGVALPGEKIQELGRDHVPETETVRYNSNPPTSGPHYATPALWGIYTVAPKDEYLVHNLEHGGVVVSYNPDRVTGEELEQLKAQVRRLSDVNPRVILTPRANLDTAIALTAWGYLAKLDSYNAAAVKTFYDAHIGRGPECQNGLCPG